MEGNVMSAREKMKKDIDIMSDESFDYLFAIWEDHKAREEAEDEESFWQAVHDVENNENLVSFDSFEDMVRDALED
jgi:hypothetical protein